MVGANFRKLAVLAESERERSGSEVQSTARRRRKTASQFYLDKMFAFFARQGEHDSSHSLRQDRA